MPTDTKDPEYHFSNQRQAIEEMKQRHEPIVTRLGGNDIVALPNVYAGWLDSELMCEVLQISEGATVLDLCTGTGVVAMKAAQLGASKVVAVDLNPDAVKSVILNKEQLGLDQVVALEGSLFEPVKGEIFDVIVINPPYVNHKAADKTEICFWDEGNVVTKAFFKEFRSYLKPDGKVYFGWGDFADMNLLESLCQEYDVTLKLLGSKPAPSGRETFLAYEFILKKS